MKIKVFEPNRYGKIEFTRAELEKLLNEVYSDGYREGESDARSRTWTWTSPFISSTTTNKFFDPTTATTTLASTNCPTNKIEITLDDSAATTCNNVNVDKTPVYSVKANDSISSADISKLVSDIFAAGAPRSAPKKVEDAFDKLAKELSF